MISRLINFFRNLKELNLKLFLKIILIILKKDYSKYPNYVSDFEDSLSKRFETKYCLTFSSGTAAFYASLFALNLKKGSKVLVSSLTFPTVIKTLKKFNFEIYYFDINRNFEILFKNVNEQKYDLLVATHPFGFYINFENLKPYLNHDSKIILDASHSQGMKINNVEHVKLANISFMSLQGNKSISGGEGGIMLTDDEDLYLKMIDNHHPGHKKNKNIKVAGAINDLKLRMHPLAAVLASFDLKSFEKKNLILKKKIEQIYDCLDKLNVKHPFTKTSIISGFHFGIPFFFSDKINSEIIKKYNWYTDLDSLQINSILKQVDKSFFNELYFIDLEWIKKNDIFKIIKKIDKIFRDAY